MTFPTMAQVAKTLASGQTPTRENCQQCGNRGLGFYSPKWVEITGERYRWNKWCVVCFGKLGDEKGIAWEQGLEPQFSSLRTQRKIQEFVPVAVTPLGGTE